MPATQLTAGDIQAYRRNGHVVIRGLFSPEEVAAYRPIILDLCRPQLQLLKPMNERDTYGKAFVQVMHLWEKDARLKALSLSPKLGRVVADLMGVDRVRIFHDQSLLKEPGGGYTPWHQDNWYIPFDTPHILTMWMPMVDCSAEMGTMRFASGSHKAGLFFDGGTSDDSQEHLEKLIQERRWDLAHCGDMKAGDASFHDGWTIHGAGPNRSSTMRESFLVGFYADGARIIERGPWQGAIAGHLKGQKLGDLVGNDQDNPVVFDRG